MGSILGMGFLNGHSAKNEYLLMKLLTELFYYGQINASAKEATGIAFANAHAISVLKEQKSPIMFTKDEVFLNACKKCFNIRNDIGVGKLHFIIGKCRSRMWWEEKKHTNTQPIVAGKTVGIHEGLIANPDKLFDTFKTMDVGREGECNSEIIFKLIDHFVNNGSTVKEAMCLTSDLISGSAACAFVHAKDPFTLWIFKLLSVDLITILHFPDDGIVLFSNSRDSIEKAITYSSSTLGTPNVINLNAREGIGINFSTNKFDMFSLTSPAPIEEFTAIS